MNVAPAEGLNGFLEDLAKTALPEVVQEVEIRTALTPPLKINVAKALQGGGGKAATGVKSTTALILNRIQPGVILRSDVIGNKTIAPFGLPGRDDYKRNLLILFGGAAVVGGLLTAALLGVGRSRGRRAERRNR